MSEALTHCVISFLEPYFTEEKMDILWSDD